MVLAMRSALLTVQGIGVSSCYLIKASICQKNRSKPLENVIGILDSKKFQLSGLRGEKNGAKAVR